jgi:hypothetical protein
MGGPEKRAHQQTNAGDDRSSDDDVSLAVLVRDRAKRRRVLADDSSEATPGAGLPPQQRASLESAGQKTRVLPSNGVAHASTADGAHEPRAVQQLHERETDAWPSLEAESGDQPQSNVQQRQVSTPLHLLLCTFGLMCRCTQSQYCEASVRHLFAWPVFSSCKTKTFASLLSSSR